MPRFYFHVRCNCRELSRDGFGFDLPDVETACLMTISAARDLRTVFADRGQDPRDYVIEIRNAADELVFELPFTAALDQQDPQLPRRFPH